MWDWATQLFGAWTDKEWAASAAVVGAVVAVFSWLTSYIGNAITYRREQSQREWKRLGELMIVLYNKDFEKGQWAQMAAVEELRTLKAPRWVIADIAKSAADHRMKNSGDGSSPNLVTVKLNSLAMRPFWRLILMTFF